MDNQSDDSLLSLVPGPSTSNNYIPTSAEDSPPLAPAEYLFNRTNLHDCYFRVGCSDGENDSEEMGVVKAMLQAHSPVFRNMLEESIIREDTRKIISLPDIQPDAFKLLLKYVYNSLEEPLDLSRDMAMKLFFAADKYLIEPLRKKAIQQLIPQTVEEVFPALYCITLCTNDISSLENVVKTIVQTHTMEVFQCPEFLDLNLDSLVYILKQPILNCREIEVWKACVKWAERQGQTSDGSVLRQILKEPLKHIRLCTISEEQIFTEIAPKNILTDSETLLVLKVMKSIDLPDLRSSPPEFCINKTQRTLCDPPFNVPAWGTYFDLQHKLYVGEEKVSGCRMDISESTMTLKSITCRGKKSPFREIDFLTGTRKYTCQCKVILSIYDNDILREVCVVNFNEEVNYEEEFIIMTMYEGNYLKLKPRNVYRIHLEFTEPHPRWCSIFRDGEPVCMDHYFGGGWLDCYWSCNHIVRLHFCRQ